MKYATIGIAMMAALALAAVGAGTASAKVCSTDAANNTHTPVTSCGAPHGDIYNGGIHTENAGSIGAKQNATLISSFIAISCDSTVAGELTTTQGKVTAVTFSNCTSAQGTNCSAISTATPANPWPMTGEATTAPDGTLESSNVGGQFSCTVFGIKTTCVYADSTIGDKGEITVTGGTTATMKLTKVALQRQAGSGFGCSETANVNATYSITTPESVYFT